MDDITRLNRAAYDHIAPRFAEYNQSMPAELTAAAAWLQTALVPGARILDLCCGTGRDKAWLQALGLRVTGADLSAGMLAQASAYAGGPLCQMDMRRLGFVDGSFQAVWCIAALLHLPKSEAPLALAEMARVLAPSGRMYLSTQAGSGETIEQGAYDDPSARRFFTGYAYDELAGLLRQAGLAILEHGENQTKRRWIWFKLMRAG